MKSADPAPKGCTPTVARRRFRDSACSVMNSPCALGIASHEPGRSGIIAIGLTKQFEESTSLPPRACHFPFASKQHMPCPHAGMPANKQKRYRTLPRPPGRRSSAMHCNHRFDLGGFSQVSADARLPSDGALCGHDAFFCKRENSLDRTTRPSRGVVRP